MFVPNGRSAQEGMGGIVSSGTRRERPASARRDGDASPWRAAWLRGGSLASANGRFRPISAPPSLVVAAERGVEISRRAETLERSDALQTGGLAGRVRVISLDQDARLDRRVCHALVDHAAGELEGNCGLQYVSFWPIACLFSAYLSSLWTL